MAFCGPTAVAAITGWPRDRVLLHLRAMREMRGRRIHARTGARTSSDEMRQCLIAAGWHVAEEERTTLAEVGRAHPGSWYLVRQPGHLFAWKRSTHWKYYRAQGSLRVQAWRVTRRPIPAAPTTSKGAVRTP